MSPVELLGATQKAIGDSRLADLHKELIEEKKSSNVLSRVRSWILWNTLAYDKAGPACKGTKEQSFSLAMLCMYNRTVSSFARSTAQSQTSSATKQIGLSHMLLNTICSV